VDKSFPTILFMTLKAPVGALHQATEVTKIARLCSPSFAMEPKYGPTQSLYTKVLTKKNGNGYYAGGRLRAKTGNEYIYG
jgi:hypothetical protein